MPHTGDIGSTKLSPVAGTQITAPSIGGISAYNAGSTTNRIEFDTPYSSGDMTIISVCSFTSVGSGRVVAGVFKDAGNAVANYISLETSGAISAVSTDNGNWASASGPVAQVGALYYLVATFKSGGSRAIFVNGEFRARNTTGRTPAAMTKLLVGSYLASGSYSSAITGFINLAAVLPVCLSDAEAAKLSQNPWQIFRKSARIFYFPSAGGGGAYTLDANSGSFALTGSSVELTVSRQIDATSGSFAFSGTNVSLEFGRVIDATSGSFALTGTNAELSVGRQIDATSGSFALTGTDVDLTYTPAGAYSIDLTSGSYALTGSNVSLEVGRQLDSTTGSYAFTGTTVDLARGYSFDLNSGAFAFTGTNADLTVSRALDAESGAFSFSGTNVSLEWSGAPVDETHVTGGGGSRPVLLRERRVRDEVDEYFRKKREADLKAQIAREDDEICLIMAALAA